MGNLNESIPEGVVSLPVIDLSGNRGEVSRAILDAGKNIGFFQVINHGVSEQAMRDMESACREFFALPAEDKAVFYSEDNNKTNRYFSGSTYETGGNKYWMDCLRLGCSIPAGDSKNNWPDKPQNLRYFINCTQKRSVTPNGSEGIHRSRSVRLDDRWSCVVFARILIPLITSLAFLLSGILRQAVSSTVPWRVSLIKDSSLFSLIQPSGGLHHLSKLLEVIEKFTVLTRDMGMELLRLLCEAMGLRPDYFEGDLGGADVMVSLNHYPACPDPSTMIGLPPHCDRNLLSLLLPSTVPGLQFSHNGEWINVEPLPNAFIVNFGLPLEVVTNGMLRSIEHRVVTNTTMARTSVVTFITPTKGCLITPAEEFLGEENPPRYHAVTYGDFIRIHSIAKHGLSSVKTTNLTNVEQATSPKV